MIGLVERRKESSFRIKNKAIITEKNKCNTRKKFSTMASSLLRMPLRENNSGAKGISLQVADNNFEMKNQHNEGG